MIALLLTPLARYAFIALAVLAVTGGLYGKGRHDQRIADDAKIAGMVSGARLAAAEARAAVAEKDAKDNAALALAAKQEAATARADADSTQEKLDALAVADKDPDLSRWKPVDLGRLSKRPGG